MSGRRAVGYLMALAAGVLWGTSGPFTVLLLRLGLPATSITFYRLAVGGLAVGALCVAVRRSALRGGRAQIVTLGIGGGLMLGCFQAVFQQAIEAAGVPTAVALLYLYPIIVVLAADPLLGESLTLRRLGLAAMVVTGVWLTVSGAREAGARVGTEGILWGLGSSVLFAGYVMFGRYAVGRYGVMTTVLYSTLGAATVVGAAFAVASGRLMVPTSEEAWLLILGYGVGTVVGAQVLFLGALRWIEAGHAAVAASVEPVAAAVLASLLVQQRLAGAGWLGIVVVVAGVAATYLATPRGATSPADRKA
ncbi:MAG: EamA family transporter [Gemmatimonadetes bacterium]|nr:EamA family transporter [Gemmatimonadota bacterium]